MRSKSAAAAFSLLLGIALFLPSGAAANGVASIVLTKTVGTPPGCATANEIEVPVGTQVLYCYTVHNNGGTDLLTHTLTDDVLGTIVGPSPAMSLAKGQIITITVPGGPVTQSVKNTAVSMAMTDSTTVSDTAMATVTVLEGAGGCADNVDNNLDGLIDCDDPECAGAAACAPVPAASSFGLAALALVLLAAGTFALSARRRPA
jgi:hypothetical protein